MIVAPDEALTLPVDQLALRLLAWLGKTVNGLHNRRNVLLGARQSYDHNGCHDNGPVVRALGEAFDWLCYRGLLAPDPEQDNFFYITSRGREVLQSSTGAAALRATDRLAVDLHPRIAARARAQFLMGEHELAAFTAFREVEIRVRELANAGNDAIGVPLMRSAFKPSGGALTDPGLESGEQEAMSALFVGAMGVFKNPTSHRRVEYADPTVASEVVLLGDLLLRMLDDVERRRTPAQLRWVPRAGPQLCEDVVDVLVASHVRCPAARAGAVRGRARRGHRRGRRVADALWGSCGRRSAVVVHREDAGIVQPIDTAVQPAKALTAGAPLRGGCRSARPHV